jgi:hypothetical protein
MYVCPVCDGQCYEPEFTQADIDAAVQSEREAKEEYANMWGIAHATLARLVESLDNDDGDTQIAEARNIVAAQLRMQNAIRARGK